MNLKLTTEQLDYIAYALDLSITRYDIATLRNLGEAVLAYATWLLPRLEEAGVAVPPVIRSDVDLRHLLRACAGASPEVWWAAVGARFAAEALAALEAARLYDCLDALEDLCARYRVPVEDICTT